MRKVTIVFGDGYDVNYSIELDDQLVQQMQHKAVMHSEYYGNSEGVDFSWNINPVDYMASIWYANERSGVLFDIIYVMICFFHVILSLIRWESLSWVLHGFGGITKKTCAMFAQ